VDRGSWFVARGWWIEQRTTNNVADLVMPSKLTAMLASGRPVVATNDEQ
jgi:hypothetical protein